MKTYLATAIALVAGATTLAGAAEGPRTLGKDVTADFELPEGLEVRVWAESPQLQNPTNIDVDSRGRIWALEGVNYRHSIKSHRRADGYVENPRGDRVVILEDTDGDGAADSSKVFVEDKDLVSPLGIGVIGNKVYVSSSPSVFVYTDEDGDDKADKKEVFLTGFGGFDHDHGVHALSYGPDGRLYFAAGNTGPHIVRDRSGFTVRSTRDGPSDTARPSDDGRTWLQGLILRIGEDGRGLRVLAHNFRNNFEVGLDAFGNLWENDNDDDGNQGCRLTFVLEGGNYGYTSLDGKRSWRADQRAGQTVPTAHWHLDDPGSVPPTEITGAGSPTGLAVYEGKLLPARFSGMVLNAEAGRTVVFGHTMTRAGAAWKSERINFLASRATLGDEAKRYRPSDVAVGTDGAVYIADWYDPVVGGHNMRDKSGYGRVLRVVPKGQNPRPPRIDTRTPAGALEAVLGPAVNVRALGWKAIAAAGPSAFPAVKARLSDKDPRGRARLLWLLPRLGRDGRDALFAALEDRDESIRLTAFRVLRAAGNSWIAHADRLARDPSAHVRRELAIALRDVPAREALPRLLELVVRHDGTDRMMLEAIGIGAAGKEEALYAAALAKLGGKDPVRWSSKMTALAWRLHPPRSIAAWQARLNAVSLPLPEKQRALVALAFIPHRDAVAAVVEVAEKGKDPLKSYALDLAFDRAGNEWQAFGVTDRLASLRSTKRDDARLDGLKRAVVSGAAVDERRKAVETLALDKEGGSFLIGLAAQGKLAADLQDAASANIFRNPDPGVRGLASQHFKRPSFDGAEFPAVGGLLKMKGDPKRGRTVFFSPQAACAQCHEYAGEGRSIGPGLTDIAGKMGREALFDSVLNPSAGIAFGYDPYVITTKDQQTLTGFILGDGDSVLLKDVAGEHRLIAARDIVHREKQKTSIMPDNIALGMKPQELVDLVEFLASGPGGATAGKAAAATK